MVTQYQTITADTQVCAGECYLVGVEFTHTDDAEMRVYDETSSGKTAAHRVVTLNVSAEQVDAFRVFPLPGIKCSGIFVDHITSGLGTVYYYV